MRYVFVMLGIFAIASAGIADAQPKNECVEQLRDVLATTKDEHVAVNLSAIAVFVNRTITAVNQYPSLSRLYPGARQYVGVEPVEIPPIARGKEFKWDTKEQTRVCKLHVPKCPCED